MNIEDPIIQSMADCDMYKFNMASVVFHLFPDARVKYKFINRGKTKFPDGFGAALKRHIWELGKLKLTLVEQTLFNKIPYVRRTYVEWLSGYELDPREVTVAQAGGDLNIEINGFWYRTIFWEVKLMALISELYFRMTNQKMADGWVEAIENKAHQLQENDCYWSDFGTRRRYSYEVQDEVVEVMSQYKNFLGTSNPHLAFKYNTTPQGTYAHEAVMGMQAMYGARLANKMWMKHWSEHFGGNVGVALTDTFTTDKFLEDFGSYEARLFDGVRHDSDDPIVWGNKMLRHYRNLGIPAENKRFVFSDGLNTRKFIDITNEFRGKCQVVGGIGTHFSNDVGVLPLNMVVKMVSADFGKGWVDVVKLSDSEGKHTGTPDAIRHIKCELGIK